MTVFCTIQADLRLNTVWYSGRNKINPVVTAFRAGVSKVFLVRARYRKISKGPGHTLEVTY